MKNKKRCLSLVVSASVFLLLLAFSNISFAQTITFVNPLKFSTVQSVLTSLLNSLQGIIITIAIIFIIIGAILYMTSAGDETRMKTAKGAITAAMIGLAIGIAAPSFLKEIGIILNWDCALITDPEAKAACDSVANNPKVLSAAQIALNTLNFLLSIVGVLALIMLVVGGIMYLTAAGSEDQIDKGKKIVKYSIIGIVIALAAMVIVKQIAKFFVS
jgi:hypothetical protein